MKLRKFFFRIVACLFAVVYLFVTIFTIKLEQEYRGSVVNTYEGLLNSGFLDNPNMEEFINDELRMTLNKKYKYMTTSELLNVVYHFYILDSFSNLSLQMVKFNSLMNGEDISDINNKINSLNPGNFDLMNEVFPINSSYSLITPFINEAKLVLDEESLNKFTEKTNFNIGGVITTLKVESSILNMYAFVENLFLLMSFIIFIQLAYSLLRKKSFNIFKVSESV